MKDEVLVRDLGLTDYSATWQAMRHFTQTRTSETCDEIWFTSHPPVFTLGQAGKPEHLLFPGEIPIVETDRGGQVTYHGPGQIVMYVLWDLARLKLGVRNLVRTLENAVIGLLQEQGIQSEGRLDAPGVYVAGSKIASVGLRIRQGRSYHGLALNAAMDLEPFSRINPCGYAGLKVTDCRSIGLNISTEDLKESLTRQLHLARQEALKDR
jgi:lipoyl(octanoyl) transferase